MAGIVNVDLFLRNQKAKYPALTTDWQILEEYYLKKLWHQLTQKMLEFLKKPEVVESTILLDIYDNFLCDFEHIINPLSLAEMLILIAQKMRTSGKPSSEIMEFVGKVRDKVFAKAKNTELATILSDLTCGLILLEDCKDFPATRKIIEETEVKLNEFDHVTSVHDRYFFLSSSYHRAQGNHAEYYREALRYLGCCKLSELSLEDQRHWAFTIGVAALLGKGVYNFGELLMHDVLKSLEGSQNSWITELLFAFNKGDIEKFNSFMNILAGQPDLLSQEAFLRQKITLMCLIELSFHRPTTERLIPFSEISKAACVPEDQVEFLLMKALSLDLIRGKINEIDKCVLVSWVQPRVLDLSQIASMQQKNSGWVTSVSAMEDMVKVDARDILG